MAQVDGCDHLYRGTTMVCVLCQTPYGGVAPEPQRPVVEAPIESRTDTRDDLKRPEHGGKPVEPVEQFAWDGKFRRVE